MNAFLSAGTKLVIFALAFYSVAIITEQRKRLITKTVLSFITLGVVFDIVATIFMIKGSSNTPFTLHGILGYSSLCAMLVDAVLLWRYRLQHGEEKIVTKGLHLYSRFAYGWWVMAFITGSLLGAAKYI